MTRKQLANELARIAAQKKADEEIADLIILVLNKILKELKKADG